MENGYHIFNFLPHIFNMTTVPRRALVYVGPLQNDSSIREMCNMKLVQRLFLHEINSRSLVLTRTHTHTAHCVENIFHFNDCSIFKTIETKGHIRPSFYLAYRRAKEKKITTPYIERIIERTRSFE